MVVVYRLTNNNNRKSYIGITKKGLATRIAAHRCAVKKGSKLRLHNAIRKHGEDAFTAEAVLYCYSFDDAQDYERSLIRMWKPEYNLIQGGEGVLGLRMPEDVRKRISLRMKGTTYHKGFKHSEETKKKMREAKALNPQVGVWKGKKRSEETKRKISQSKTGVKRAPLCDRLRKICGDNMRRAAIRRRKAVICMDDGNIFVSEKSACLFYGFSAGSISMVCRNKRKKCHGLSFKWAD